MTKGQLILLIAAIIGGISIAVLDGYNFSKKYKSEQEAISIRDKTIHDRIGKTIYIGKDSAIIVDYSASHQQYLLNNGNKIGLEYIENTHQ